MEPGNQGTPGAQLCAGSDLRNPAAQASPQPANGRIASPATRANGTRGLPASSPGALALGQGAAHQPPWPADGAPGPLAVQAAGAVGFPASSPGALAGGQGAAHQTGCLAAANGVFGPPQPWGAGSRVHAGTSLAPVSVRLAFAPGGCLDVFCPYNESLRQVLARSAHVPGSGAGGAICKAAAASQASPCVAHFQALVDAGQGYLLW